MQLIPAQLVPAAQAFIRQQGYDPNIIAYDGSINAAGIVSLAFNKVEVSTAVTPTISFPISASGEPPSPAMQELLNQLQPTVVLSGPAGRIEVAPYGMPAGQTSWLPIALFGLGSVAFLGWALFGK